ncbi:MAG: autoinducer binding domain-containing protein [Rhizobium sp.]|nr:autoinducer binding domain-containing protein [Rhizobium sp.]
MPVDSWIKFYRYIDAVRFATRERHFKRSLQTLAYNLGFEMYAYLDIRSKTAVTISNYPQEWQVRYFRQSYQKVDPVVETARRKKVPFLWSMGQREFKHEKKREFSREANEVGIRSGVTIPIPTGFGHMSLLTFASSQAMVTDDQKLDHVPSIIVASLTHAYVSIRHPRYRALGGVRMTTQEATCLRWASEGKSMDEIASLLEIRYTTVRAYLDNAREKLGAVTLIQAAATAARLNLI